MSNKDEPLCNSELQLRGGGVFRCDKQPHRKQEPHSLDFETDSGTFVSIAWKNENDARR
jgi:hypothetical protein